FLVTTIVLLIKLSVFSQCEAEPTLEKTGAVLKTFSFGLSNSAVENSLTIYASVTDGSWAKAGAEAAVVTVFVDGKYNQDVILFAGPKNFSYELELGELGQGAHTITVVLNEAHSAANAKQVKVYALSPGAMSLNSYVPLSHPVPKNSPQYYDFDRYKKTFLARSNSPFIYARPNSVDKFTDIPLITYYEIFDEPNNVVRIRYTIIFSNEDGGTPAAALLARWGRLTDIEWIYEVRFKDDKIVSEIYQAANHQTKNFTGKRIFGSHPLFLTATDNNNFADTGCTALRFGLDPVDADLSAKSRETVMDQNSWTYQIMAQEATRENRINPVKLDVNTIDDLRNYLYVEVFAENKGTAVSLEITDGNGKTSQSDWNNPLLRVDRNGYFRIAVRLPESLSKANLITLRCYVAGQTADKRECRTTRIIKISRLDNNFVPHEIIFDVKPAANLKPNETATYKIKN
ncbi:MAG: hypothetical protein ABI954_11285, partial [Pyrinomonadaceae bacterium]